MGLLTAGERTSLVEILMNQTQALGPLGAMQLMQGMPQDLADLTRVTGVRLVDITNIVAVVDSATAQRADGSWPVLALVENAISIAPASTHADRLRRLHDLLLARSAADQAGVTLEGLVNLSAAIANPELWVDRMAQCMLSVCRVITPNMHGTGFLVGPNLVMTNHHVVGAVLGNPGALAQVSLEFDYRKDAQGRPLEKEARKTYTPVQDAQILSSPFEDLDYALLPVDGSPGDDQVQTRFGTVARKWLTPAEKGLAPDQYVFILQHPLGDYLGVAVDRITSVSDKRVQYKTNTNAGSSGSPCFNDSWELVALHHAGENKAQPTWNQGIPFGAILSRQDVKDAIARSVAGG
jgi:V8-like Glu-specific endopeptidase